MYVTYGSRGRMYCLTKCVEDCHRNFTLFLPCILFYNELLKFEENQI